MEDKIITIEDVVNEYKKLSILDKKMEIGKEFVEMINVLDLLIADFYNENEFNLNDNKFDDIVTVSNEDEWFNSLYTRILQVKELLGIFCAAYIAEISMNKN